MKKRKNNAKERESARFPFFANKVIFMKSITHNKKSKRRAKKTTKQFIVKENYCGNKSSAEILADLLYAEYSKRIG